MGIVIVYGARSCKQYAPPRNGSRSDCRALRGMRDAPSACEHPAEAGGRVAGPADSL